MATGEPYPPISDYGLIGDSRACALVSRDGSIDWLCLPRPDSKPVFGRLLDWESGGHFQIAPLPPYEATRRYLPRTNVLETTFTTAEGSVVLTDFMPALPEATKSRQLHPLRAIVRTVECTGGNVPMLLTFEPRSGYDKQPFTLQRRAPRLATASRGNGIFLLHSTEDLSIRGDAATVQFLPQPGKAMAFSLTYAEEEPAVILSDTYALEVRDQTIAFWEHWCESFSYRGAWPDAVLRSALTLKLLSYAPSGAVLAAATTSLPETVGGERNWDYRFCWPRDAAWSVKELQSLGFTDEAQAFFAWLLHTTRLKRSPLQPLYSLLGRANIKEKDLDGWAGYKNSRPVRIGNAAAHQIQLDVYGELVDAAHAYLVRQDGAHRISRDEARFLETLVDMVADTWREPDSGIWEPRVPPQHYTHSKVMAWVALTRAIDLQKRGLISGPADHWQREADQIHRLVLAEGYSDEKQSFTQTLGNSHLDSSLLTLPIVGFLPAGDHRLLSTVKAIQAGLDEGGFLRRYSDFDDGLSGREGTFLICNFWLAASLARLDQLDEAKRVFERTLRTANDLHLISEQYAQPTNSMLGNFPQAFSHLGLILAALEIEAAEQRLA
ncbi:MAG TPA: glycoside hydrolase family 15 protein [Dehalococcoidia bacterium]|nr:glycoside hydrolase family 15 protein [Dehalococcoidia bacterium]